MGEEEGKEGVGGGRRGERERHRDQGLNLQPFSVRDDAPTEPARV